MLDSSYPPQQYQPLGDQQGAPTTWQPVGPAEERPFCNRTRWILFAALVVAIVVAVIIGVSVTKSNSHSAANAISNSKSMMDTTAAPCDDFYRFACGKWMDANVGNLNSNNPQIVYSFSTIAAEVQTQLINIATGIQGDSSSQPDKFMNACLNTNMLDSVMWSTRSSIANAMSLIGAAATVGDIFSIIGQLQRQSLAVGALFYPNPMAILTEATTNRAWLVPTTIGNGFNPFNLQSIVSPVFDALASAGFVTSSSNALNNFNTVNSFLNNIYTYPPNTIAAMANNVMNATVSNFVAQYPNVAIDKYFLGLSGSSSLPMLVAYYDSSSFYSQLNQALGGGGFTPITLAQLQDWLRFHVLYGYFDLLPATFRSVAEQLNDQFRVPSNPLGGIIDKLSKSRFDGVFGGLTSGPDREFLARQGVRHVQRKSAGPVLAGIYKHIEHTFFNGVPLDNGDDHSNACSDMAGSMYQVYILKQWISSDFPNANRPYAETLVTRIREAMNNRLQSAAWLDSTTRNAAVAKQLEIVANVAYDPNWPGLYTTAQGSDAFNDFLAYRTWQLDGLIGEIDTPVNRNTFPAGSSIAEQNAFYSPLTNTINMLAGLMYPPFFDPTLPDEFTYAPYGMVIGHELTHGFDNNGRNFDGVGAYRNWWTPTAAANFNQRAQCLVNQYSGFQIAGMNVNGNQTLGENIADNGGIGNSWDTYMNYLSNTAPIDKSGTYTNAQYFFIIFAQSWCEVATDAAYQNQIQYDVHSPGPFRVLGPLSNLPAFANTWQCSSTSVYGRSLTPARCYVW